MASLLFLDDDLDRHWQFRTRVYALGYAERYRMIFVFTADEAIQALREHEGDIAQAFLDHDLSEGDIGVEPGAPTKVLTGMTAVDHIVTMPRPPDSAIVHSLNYSAAIEMCAPLEALRTIAVMCVPFSLLLSQLT